MSQPLSPAADSTPKTYANLILNPSPTHFPATRFTFHSYLKEEYRFGLDPSRKTCALYLQGHCPLGNTCADKHILSTSFNNLVCKHWLRSLCKKNDGCEFLHEYNLRKMPECNFFIRNGYCSNGEECLYLHIDPDSKLPPCPHYDNGFCPLGPQCSKKHVRKTICKFFIAGFCPDGKGCMVGIHPKWVELTNLPPPTLKRVREDGDGAGAPAGKIMSIDSGGDRFTTGGRGGGPGRRRFFGRRGGGQ